jgi:hypothetical protein
MPVNGGEAASLVESAMLLRWRAPELALLLADRAVTAAQDDKMAVLRADHLAVFSLNRLGRHGEAAHRLFPTLADVETPQGLRQELLVELAHCAVALGEPAIALGAVRAVLAVGEDVAPLLRGGALIAVAEASVSLGRHDLVTSALAEADELYSEDPNLDHDTALLLRATARAVDAARHRRRGATIEAEAKAREGRELLAGLADPEHDSGEVSARLMLEIALILLERDEGEAVLQEVRPLLRRPVRAAAAGVLGRIRLALATRVHLAEGRHEPALTLLADAVEGAQRYGVDAVLAECLEGLSHVHEARDEFADALHCMRAAHAAEGRHRRDVEAARATLLENCGSARREEARLLGQITKLLGNTGAGCGGLDPDTVPLHVEVPVHPATGSESLEEYLSESEAAESGTAESETAEPETAEHEVAGLETTAPPVAAEPAASVREPNVIEPAAEPDSAEVEAADGESVPAQAIGQAVAETGVTEPDAADLDSAGSEVGAAEDTEQVAAELMPASPELSVVEPVLGPDETDALPIVEQGAQELVSKKGAELHRTGKAPEPYSWQSKARHRRGAGALVSVSDLLPASALSSGRSGRRRAEESADEAVGKASAAELRQVAEGNPGEKDDTGGRQVSPGPDTSSEEATDFASPRREFPPGPPPAPTPRALDWAPVDEDPEDEVETDEMGLGDLLAEALAAYQESRGVRADARSAGTDKDDVPEEVETKRELPRYRGLGTRWVAGLALAPKPIDGEDRSSDALTNPLLRLPDLTAEPRWLPPESGRRPAAGN